MKNRYGIGDEVSVVINVGRVAEITEVNGKVLYRVEADAAFTPDTSYREKAFVGEVRMVTLETGK